MWRRATLVVRCTPGWSTAGARAARRMPGALPGPLPLLGPAGFPLVPRRSPLSVRRVGPGCAGPPLFGLCGRPGQQPSGCSRYRAYSDPGSSPAPPRSTGGGRTAACPTAGSTPTSGPGRGCCLGHQSSPVQWPRFHAGQRAGTLLAGGVGSAGALAAGGPLIISRLESAFTFSCGGSLSPPLSPSALMTSCAASSVGDQGRVLRGAAGSGCVTSPCLRAGNGVRISRGWCTCCGCGGVWVGEPVCWLRELGPSVAPPALPGVCVLVGALGAPPIAHLARVVSRERALRRCEGRLKSGAVPPPAARPLGGLSGSAFRVLWARVRRRGGPTHCPPGLHALWGAAYRGGGGGPFRGGWSSTVVRGVWCQALSLPWPPVPWGGQPGFHDPCFPGALGVGVGTQQRPHSVRPCELLLRAVGVVEGCPRGGCLSPL